jgi:hypothetical protein
MNDTNGNANGGSEREERLQLMLSPDELTLIDDFRFRQRMPSRAAAVRELMKRGLTVEGISSVPSGSKSSEFGVAGAAKSVSKSKR